MPGENFSRRVARAASIGGGRNYRAPTPRGWSLLLLVICVLGVALIGYSRYERQHPSVPAAKPSVPPTAASEWRSAISVDICGSFEPSALPVTPTNATGEAFETLRNGVVDLAPGRSAAPTFYEGHKAVLGLYLETNGVTVTKKSLVIPGEKLLHPKATTSTTTSSTTTSSTSTSTSTSTTTAPSSSSVGPSAPPSSSSTTTTTTVPHYGPARHFVSGHTHCGPRVGAVQVMVWRSPSSPSGHLVNADSAGQIRFRNGQLVTIAFVAKGTAIPKPPGTGAVAQYLLANPHGRATGVASPTTTPPTSPPTTPTTSASSSSSTSTTSGTGVTTTSSGK